MAIGSAFAFTVMMFNVPIPGGTTAHAVGATLLAIALGPVGRHHFTDDYPFNTVACFLEMGESWHLEQTALIWPF